LPPASRKAPDNTELPIEPIEPKPEDPNDVKFKVRIFPVIFQGAYSWKWEMLDHTHKSHIGDFTKIVDPDAYASEEMAVEYATRQVNNIRHVAGLKLAQPAEKIIEL
jgi:hypothetical protein